MKLSIKNRLNFGILYPEKGNILTQILVKSIVEKVTLTQDEIKEINLKQEGTVLQWDDKNAKDKEIEFTEAEINLLKERVKELDDKKEINQQTLGLCLLIQEYKKEEKIDNTSNQKVR